MRGDGIKSIKDVMDRCYVDEHGCWIWRGPVWQGVARAWYGPMNSTRSLPGILYHVKHGTKVPAGKVYRSTCGNNLCMKHRALGTKSEMLKGIELPERAKINAAIRATKQAASKYTPELMAEFKEAKYGQYKATAERMGLDYKYALRLLRGNRQGAVPGSSVFSWRP